MLSIKITHRIGEKPNTGRFMKSLEIFKQLQPLFTFVIALGVVVTFIIYGFKVAIAPLELQVNNHIPTQLKKIEDDIKRIEGDIQRIEENSLKRHEELKAMIERLHQG